MHTYFANKVVIVSGGGGGIGQALVNQLLDCQAKVAVLDLELASLTSSENLLPIAVDITDEAALTNAVEEIHQRFGRIDILINNAGVTHLQRFNALPASTFARVMAINFTASVNLTRICLPHLIRAQGNIAAISSVAGFAPLYGRTAYSASKHAMHGFFGSLATELMGDQVAVTIICPAFVRSRPELKARPSNGLASPGASKRHTAGRQLSPDHAAQQILKAIRSRRLYALLGRVSIVSKWLFNLFPGIYIGLMVRGARQEFTDP